MAEQADRINTTSLRFRDFCARNPVETLHTPISNDELTRLDHALDDNNIPAATPSNQNGELAMVNRKCCCGLPDCAYLEHNNAALGGLERDLETAARLGQALLDRHEAYVKESQAEQARLSNYVSDLEDEKAGLQDANHKIVVDNKELLQKLEQLNNEFGESGHRVQELETLLQDCEQEIRRLHGLTRKTQELELKMLDMETERVELNKDMEEGRLETRSTIARWKESQRKVRELEHEIQKIEFEAKLDRERHEEIVARMEKERALERELGLSEGRLKATAAVQNLDNGGPRQKQVVSNFVRDILQDNANLQAGIAELRDLLQSSNDEVQNLRDQVMLHQPLPDDEIPTQQRTQSLSEELGFSQSLPKQGQQEVHVHHHHYHTKATSKKERATPLRRTVRRKALMPSQALSPSPSSSGTSTPFAAPHRHVSSPAVPLSILPSNATTGRWSMQSTNTTSTYLSSIASSPRSYFDRNNSIFDRLDTEEELSRPTSPESFSIASPQPFKRWDRLDRQALSVFEEESPGADEHGLPPENAVPEQIPPLEALDHGHVGGRHYEEDIPDLDLTPRPSVKLKPHPPSATSPLAQSPEPQAPAPPRPPDHTETPKHDPPPTDRTDTQADEQKATDDEDFHVDVVGKEEHATTEDRFANHYSPTLSQIPKLRPSHRRSNSHDSLVSISGMDIHLVQRPTHSALTLLRTTGANKHHFAPSPATTRKVSATQPLASVTEYTATSRPGLDNQPSASMLALSGIARNTNGQANGTGGRGLMGSVGGWVSRKWGVAPTKSVADLRSAAASPATVPPFLAVTTPSSARPSGTHAARSPLIKSSASVLTALTTSSIPSIPSMSTGKRTFSTNALDVPSTSTTLSTSAEKRPAPLLDTSLGVSTAMRKPGINQAGPIPGFAAVVAARKAPTQIEARQVDLTGLEESLAGQ